MQLEYYNQNNLLSIEAGVERRVCDRFDVSFGSSFHNRAISLRNHAGLEAVSVEAFEHPILGLDMQQNRYAPMLIDCLLLSHKPRTIIEFGTRTGGLSVLLGLWAHLNSCEILTLDTQGEPKYKSIMDKLGVKFFDKDIFDEETVSFLKEKIEAPEKCIVFCDADKAREFNVYSDFLKTGDVILAHDYAHNAPDFANMLEQKIWKYNELQYTDISGACLRNSLQYVDHDLFRLGAWGGFYKRIIL